jgi:hypothetical protein
MSCIILEGVVVLHEMIHELHHKKIDGVLFKIDFERALRMKGFPDLWCEWVARFVQGGSVGIRVNDDIGHYFQTLKGLRQGDCNIPGCETRNRDNTEVCIAFMHRKSGKFSRF